MSFWTKNPLAILSTAAFAASTMAAAPQAASADALHVSCFSPTPTCTDNGTITPTDDNSPNFSFHKAGSSTPAGEHFYLAVLIPDSVMGANAEVFTINGTYTGLSSVAGTLVSNAPWTSGSLDSYLGISASPNNPLHAFLDPAQAYEPLATGFYVYTLDFGNVTFGSHNPNFTTSFDLPAGTVITGFGYYAYCKKYDKHGDCKQYDSGWNATANSAALLITGQNTGVPEPATLALLGAGLAGLGFMRRKQPTA